jgi:hypothetical protein
MMVGRKIGSSGPEGNLGVFLLPKAISESLEAHS